ncbi:MAG: helix-turn-helix domain-containing protein [Pseudonocardiaceae bacterium]
MSTTGGVSCPECGAGLRRGQRPGTRCGPCRTIGLDPHRALPPGFYLQDRIVAALAGYDFGTLFREVRAHTGWSQQTLGNLFGLDQSRISAIERGASWLCDVRLVARIATVLGIPAELLGFTGRGVTLGRTRATGRKGENWMDRRDFTQHVAGLALGVAGAAGLDIGRLMALLPQADPAGVRRVGVADIEIIEQLTATFRHQDFTGDSGLARDAAIAQVQAVLPLLDAQIAEELVPRLQLAAADLAAQAGWMSFVANRHEAARRLWMIGLTLARDAEHPQATDLTVYLLADMALQAVHLERPQEAVHLGRIGDAAAVGRYPVAESTTGLLANIQAQAYAAHGDARACERACGQATEHFSNIDPTTSPPWTEYIGKNGAGPGGGQGSAYYALARPGRDPAIAGRAVLLLREVVDRYGAGYSRLRGRYLPDLSGAHAIAGDHDTAVTLGHQAIDLISTQSSSENRDRLRLLNTVLQPLHPSPGVAELRDRLTATAA